MSKYTTELRWVMEQALDDLGLANEEDNWKQCWKVVGLDDYPLYDETHRDALNTKIVRRYYTREIGAETVGRWRMFVRDAMHSIMPYYNQLYESEVKVKGIDFMNDRDLEITQEVAGTEKKTETGSETQVDTGSSKSSSESSQTGHADTTTDVDTTVTGDSWNTSDSKDTNVFSDTPQSMMVPDQIEKMQYASNVTIDTVHSDAKAGSRNVTDGTTTVTADDTSSASGSGTGSYDNSSNRNSTDSLSRDTTDDLKRHEVGVLSSRANLLKEWRENMMNIDDMVVSDRELRECFMTVW